MNSPSQTGSAAKPGVLADLQECWHEMPHKGLFCLVFAAWFLLFHLLGNSNLGYIKTSSLFTWLHWVYGRTSDDEIGFYMPLVVLGLMWWKRAELLSVPKRIWWPALGLLVLAGLVHVLGYRIQQGRISVVAFFVGLYGLMGLVWGWRWLRHTFFPFFLFAFCVPLAHHTEVVTFPLRLYATHITTFLSHTLLGIEVIQDGTRIFDPQGGYQYEVAAACSGIRSLTVTVALACIWAFTNFHSTWRRALMIASAAPLAIAANVVRLGSIILAAQAFGQEAGNRVHESWWMSLLPYVPAIGGLLLLGRWLSERSQPQPEPATPLISQAQSNP